MTTTPKGKWRRGFSTALADAEREKEAGINAARNEASDRGTEYQQTTRDALIRAENAESQLTALRGELEKVKGAATAVRNHIRFTEATMWIEDTPDAQRDVDNFDALLKP